MQKDIKYKKRVRERERERPKYVISFYLINF